MLASYNWIKDFFPHLDIAPSELGEMITRAGIEVEDVTCLEESLKKIVVGEVLECENHPSADKLRKCLVRTDEKEPVQIICGAQNIAKGQKVIIAKVGARLPGGLKIKRAKLRGEISEGMICSLKELGIDSKVIPKKYQDGIFVFPDDATVGANAITLLGLNDHVLDLAITPNRADALNYIGIAYEVGAIIHRKPNKLTKPSVKEKGKINEKVHVTVESSPATPYYAVKIIENVTIKESPLWLQSRLMKSGIRPCNNVVDVTNYINLLYGQPLHAFDYDQLGSKEIVVRMAKEGEKIVTLDEKMHILRKSDNVITNGKEPIAIAGIMGGKNSEVTEKTTTVLLEGAIFEAKTIGKTSRELGLRTEASIRYDKGSDYFKVEEALAHGASLIAELSEGTLLSGVKEKDYRNRQEIKIKTSLKRINDLLGTTITVLDLKAIFDRLQFPVEINHQEVIVAIPLRRWDITIEADIIEEIARIYGYDNIPTTLPKTASVGGLNAFQTMRRTTRKQLEASGLTQCLTYSLTSKKESTSFALTKEKPVRLQMPMSEEHSHLRTSLIPGLLQAASYNTARKNPDLAFYELGKVFYKREDEILPKEEEHLAGLISGNWEHSTWEKKEKPADFFILKGILEAFHEKIGFIEPFEYKKVTREGMHPGRTAEIHLNNEKVGYIGQIHPNVQKQYEVAETYIFELNFAALLHFKKKQIKYQMVPRFPEMKRDIAIVVNKQIENRHIESIIQANGSKLLKEINLFDLFEGEAVGVNCKSLAYTLTFFDPSRTLIEEEVTNITNQITNALKYEVNATIR